MLKKIQWFWTAYSLFLLSLIIKEAYYLFVPDSKITLYYMILRGLDPAFTAAYIFYILRLLSNFIHFLLLFLFIYRIRFLSPRFWQSLFVARCLLEVLGNSHEATSLIALSHTDPVAVWLTIIAVLSPYIPSYFVSYCYAFRQEEIFA